MKVLDTLRCYFFGITFVDNFDLEADGLCGFAIPDLGVSYKSRVRGSLFECQYYGLLALTRFISMNIKSLKGIDFEVLTDAAVVVHQLNNPVAVSRKLREIHGAALGFKSRFQYRISWIPRRENEALNGMLEAPALNPEIEIEFNNRKIENRADHDRDDIWL